MEQEAKIERLTVFSVPFRISQIAKTWSLAIFKYPSKKQWYKLFLNIYFHTHTLLQKTEFSFKSFIFQKQKLCLGIIHSDF